MKKHKQPRKKKGYLSIVSNFHMLQTKQKNAIMHMD